MRITQLDESPFWAFSYRNVDGKGNPVSATLPVHRGTVDRLPVDIEALICAADLQGFVHVPVAEGEGLVLLGQGLPSMLSGIVEAGHIPPLSRCGAVLAGDLFADTRRRERRV